MYYGILISPAKVPDMPYNKALLMGFTMGICRKIIEPLREKWFLWHAQTV